MNRFLRQTTIPPLNLEQKDFQSIADFFCEFNVQISPARADEYRMVQPAPGEVKGQPHLGSVLIRATDGIHAMVETYERNAVMIIHLTNFLGEVKPQRTYTKSTTKPKKPKTTKIKTKKPTKIPRLKFSDIFVIDPNK
tara:strand:+ start:4206 stop:4619 length:414 start_codon:yes stop_codon:yes gene_type:complete